VVLYKFATIKQKSLLLVHTNDQYVECDLRFEVNTKMAVIKLPGPASCNNISID